MAFSRPSLVPYADIDIDGVENIPSDGPAILVGNHRSYFDPAVMAMVVAKSGRTVRFLGKKEVFDVPLLGSLAKAMGGIRVDRGTGSDEPLRGRGRGARRRRDGGDHAAGHDPARSGVLRPGAEGPVGRRPPGPADRRPGDPGRAVGDREGLAAHARLPNVLNVVDPPHVTPSVGRPVELKHKSLAADTKRIMKAIVELLPPEARIRHVPTAEELAATYPPGYTGRSRRRKPSGRPGTD